MVVNSKQWLALYSRDVPECQLSDLQLDSRKVTAGQVFLALPGVNQHGNQFIPQALAQGEGVCQDHAHALIAAARAAGVPALNHNRLSPRRLWVSSSGSIAQSPARAL